MEVPPSLISAVKDPVMQDVKAWQETLLDAVYSIVWLDNIHEKMPRGGHF